MDGTRWSKTYRWAETAAVVAVLWTLALARQGFNNAFNTLIAEDGNVFFSQATHRSILEQFTHAYAGYLHTAPRILGLAATWVPLAWSAAVITVGAALVTSLLAAVVYVASADYLSSRWSRLIVAIGLVLLPVLRVENLNDAMNLQWSLLYATFWVLIWRTKTKPQFAISIAVVSLMTFSQPLSALFFVLLGVRLFILRDRRSLILAIVMCAGWTAQAIAVLRQSQRSTFTGSLTHAQVWNGYVHDAFSGVFPDVSLLSAGSVSRILLLAILGLLLSAAVVMTKGRKLLLPVVALLMSIALYLGPVLGGSDIAPRYLVAPGLLLLVVIVAILDSIPFESWKFAAIAILAATLAVGWVGDFKASSFRNAGASWSSQVSWAKQTCAGTDRSTEIDLQTLPLPWFVTLNCGYIDDH